jgi:beta-ribofuranosylaminobenzene 5'-phosphate synthase
MTVTVSAPARLHLGLLDMNGGLGRMYGSIGVAIERPRIVLEAEPLAGTSTAGSVTVEGSEGERMEAFARRFLQRHPLPGGTHLRLRSSVPAHVGLGSGTQLALAVGAALARSAGLALDAGDLALATGRGAHSGIGISVFRQGGFVVDGGHRTGEAVPGVPPVLFHHAFPQEWLFVVAVPLTAHGASGEQEQRALQNLPAPPPESVEKICRLLVMKMLPALVEHDIAPFGQALTEIQQRVGDCFAAAQGGRYASTLSDRLVERFLAWGAFGAGQSSWGPVVYALADGEEQASSLARKVDAFMADAGSGWVFCTRADNRGARIACA